VKCQGDVQTAGPLAAELADFTLLHVITRIIVGRVARWRRGASIADTKLVRHVRLEPDPIGRDPPAAPR
jgi:hypothetical protein